MRNYITISAIAFCILFLHQQPKAMDEIIMLEANSLSPLKALALRLETPSLDLQKEFLTTYESLYNKGIVYTKNITNLNLTLKSWDPSLYTDPRFLLLCAQEGLFFPIESLNSLASQKHDPLSLLTLGLAYENCENVGINLKQAKIFYKAAATEGSLHAKFHLGYLCHEKKDYDKANHIWGEAADKGYPKAQYLLGYNYQNGHGGIQSNVLAKKYYHDAAFQGIVGALYQLGILYSDGRGIPQDFNKAMKYFQKVFDEGDPYGMLKIGRMYETGQGVEHSDEMAFECYQKCADQGLSIGHLYLGDLHLSGMGTPQNTQKAIASYLLAANDDNIDIQGRANYAIGNIYNFGKGIDKSYEDAFPYYGKGAELGNANAQYQVSLAYHLGHGVAGDKEKYLFWLQKAVEQGQKEALYLWGIHLCDGLDVPQSYTKAAILFKRAAEQEQTHSLFSLGQLQMLGLGVPQNSDAGFQLIEKSALRRNAKAQAHLGMLYENGLGVKKDDKKALKNYLSAIQNGYTTANYALACFFLKNPELNINQRFEFAQLCLCKIVNIHTPAQLLNDAINHFKNGGTQETLINDFKSLKDDSDLKSPALHLLGDIHKEGFFFTPNYKMAYDFYEQALAHIGVMEANTKEILLVKLGALSLDDPSIPKDECLAFKRFGTSYKRLHHCPDVSVIQLRSFTTNLFYINKITFEPLDFHPLERKNSHHEINKVISFKEAQELERNKDRFTIPELVQFTRECTYGPLYCELLHHDKDSNVFKRLSPFMPIPVLHKPLAEIIRNFEFITKFLPLLEKPWCLIDCISLKKQPIIDLCHQNKIPYFREHFIHHKRYLTFQEENVEIIDQFVRLISTPAKRKISKLHHDALANILVAQMTARFTKMEVPHKPIPENIQDLNIADLISIVQKAGSLLDWSGTVYNKIVKLLYMDLKNYQLILTTLQSFAVEETVSLRNYLTQQEEEFKVFQFL